MGWSIENDTTLYDHPNGSKSVALVRKGEPITAVGGEVQTRPGILVVVDEPDPHSDLKVGDALYTLTNEGEGYSGKCGSLERLKVRIWETFAEMKIRIVTGTYAPVNLLGGFTSGPDGRTGWTKEIGNFRNMDSCS